MEKTFLICFDDKGYFEDIPTFIKASSPEEALQIYLEDDPLEELDEYYIYEVPSPVVLKVSRTPTITRA